jgi:hypothetical protein
VGRLLARAPWVASLFLLGLVLIGPDDVSQFINRILDEIRHPLVGDDGLRMEVRRGLAQCTQSIQAVRLAPTRGEHRSTLSRIVLVDVPCLEDNSFQQHDRIVRDATEWLASL